MCITDSIKQLSSSVWYTSTHATEENVIHPKKYIGYTESTITERMRNHAQHGSIINHLRECHSISKIKTVELVKSVKILARGATKQELLILEALYIKEEQPSLNGQEEGRDRVLQIF